MSAPAISLLLLSLAGAGQALDRCEIGSAETSAAALDGLDAQSATLYRLAWLERAEGTRLYQAQDHEHWRDEHAGSATCARKRPTLFSRLPSDVLTPLLDPWVYRYREARPALREVLRGYLVWRWLKGDRRKLPKLEDAPSVSIAEHCEWQALRFLHSSASPTRVVRPDLGNGDALEAKECTGENGPFWAIVRAAEGDALLATGNAEAALPRFLAAIESLPDREVSLALWYRVGVAAALGGAADDLTLRSLARVLPEPDGGETSPLSPVDLAVVRTLACERLSSVKAAVLKKVFAPEYLAAGYLKLASACPSAVAVGKELLPLLRPRERLRVERVLRREIRIVAHSMNPHRSGEEVARTGGLRADVLHASSAVAIPISLSPPPLEWKVEPRAEFVHGFETDTLTLTGPAH